MPSPLSSETVVAMDIWAAAAAVARARIRLRSGAMTAPSATSATTTTSVAIGLMKSDTVINAATLRTVLSATLNDVTAPLANPAKPPSSSCNRPLGSSCCTAHDVCRYASDKRCRASLSTATERSAEMWTAVKPRRSRTRRRSAATPIAVANEAERPASTPSSSAPSAIAKAARVITTRKSASTAPLTTDVSDRTSRRPRCERRMLRMGSQSRRPTTGAPGWGSDTATTLLRRLSYPC